MSLFGDIELDLRQAAVPTGEIEVKAVAPFGDIEVIVPDGISVELTGLSVFGRKKVDVRRSSRHNRQMRCDSRPALLTPASVAPCDTRDYQL